MIFKNILKWLNEAPFSDAYKELEKIKRWQGKSEVPFQQQIIAHKCKNGFWLPFAEVLCSKHRLSGESEQASLEDLCRKLNEKTNKKI